MLFNSPRRSVHSAMTMIEIYNQFIIVVASFLFSASVTSKLIYTIHLVISAINAFMNENAHCLDLIL